MRLGIRSIIFTVTFPGVGILLIPYLILHISDSLTAPEYSPVSLFGIALWAFSVVCLLHCIRGFTRYGRGTLAPVAPPKYLVVQGVYRYTRNPMYLAVLGALVSEAMIFRSFGIFIYSFMAFVLFHLFVVYYEEPKLSSAFGVSYEKYRSAVPRWGMRVRPYVPNRTV